MAKEMKHENEWTCIMCFDICFQTMKLEMKGQKHLVIHSRRTQFLKDCGLEVRFISSDFDIQHNSPQHNTDNKIGDEGVKTLCDGLMTNTGLTELSLKGENITETRKSEKLD